MKKLDEQGFKLLDDIIAPEHRDFRDFIDYLINIDPKKRPTAREALRHKFLNTDIPIEYERIRVSRDSKSTKPSSSLNRASLK
jgi:serine/threonine protein kinase